MKKYEKEVLQAYIGREEEVIQALEKSYAQALKDINKKAKDLQDQINSLNVALQATTDPGEAIKIQSMVQSKVYQKQYQDALKTQISSILDNMQVEEFKTVSDYLVKCYEEGFAGALYSLQQQGIPMCFPMDQTAMVKAVQLDSKIVEGYYTRLGKDVADLKKKITAQVSRGIATGMSFRQVAQQLDTVAKIGFNNAVRIARTEGHRIQLQSAMDACHNAQDMGADVVKQWDSTLDGKTRPSHRKVDGEIRELDEPFSNGLQFPGDPDGGAKEVINCRCALLQRARWALDAKMDPNTGEVTFDEGGGFTKMNNFTKQLETFEKPKDYTEFKKGFFSKENTKYMDFVEQMQQKYKTRDFAKVLASMTEREYQHYSKLLQNNPVFNTKPKATPDYNTAIAKEFGKDHYDAMHDLVANLPVVSLSEVWKKYVAQIGVGNAHASGGAYASGKNVYLNIDRVAKGSSISAPYQTAFHECGHAIDSIARKQVQGGQYGAYHYSSAYKDGLFPQTIKDEVDALVSAKDKELKALFKQHAGDVDWFRTNGYMQSWQTTPPKYRKAYAYSAVEKEIKSIGNKLAYGDISDMFEGATRGKISTGIGHGASYWTQRTYGGVPDGLATEAFAEMTSATIANPESLETIKKYLPKSYQLYLDMLDSLLK